MEWFIVTTQPTFFLLVFLICLLDNISIFSLNWHSSVACSLARLSVACNCLQGANKSSATLMVENNNETSRNLSHSSYIIRVHLSVSYKTLYNSFSVQLPIGIAPYDAFWVLDMVWSLVTTMFQFPNSNPDIGLICICALDMLESM